MNLPAKTILVFGIYMLLEGAILLVAPNVLLRLVGIPPTNEIWIRLAGMSVMILGYYYIQAARSNLVTFFHWTIPIRLLQFFVFLLFVLLGLASPILLSFAAIELASGLWTAWAFRRPSLTNR